MSNSCFAKGYSFGLDYKPDPDESILAALYTSLFKREKVMVAASNFYWKKEDLVFLKEIAEKAHFIPVVDKCFQLDEIVEAHNYVETGHKVGNVAVLVSKPI